jgi:multiple sugar transport system ATP-binding protein
VVNDVPPKDRDIAMVFQSYALYPHMSVYDNMAFGLKLRKMPKDEIDRRVKEAAETLGIGQLLDRKPKALSGGQRQRVAVGRAIVREPKVFLFDEPLSNLDAKLRVSDPRRDQQAVAAAGHHLHLRDPRPGGGHDYGRPASRC